MNLAFSMVRFNARTVRFHQAILKEKNETKAYKGYLPRTRECKPKVDLLKVIQSNELKSSLNRRLFCKNSEVDDSVISDRFICLAIF